MCLCLCVRVYVRVCVCLCFCVSAYVTTDTMLALGALGINQWNSHTAYFLSGQNTFELGRTYLPSCFVRGYLGPCQLTNVNTSAVLAYRDIQIGDLSTPFIIHWPHESHPTLNASHTGLYECTMPSAKAPDTYYLHVVGK